MGEMMVHVSDPGRIDGRQRCANSREERLPGKDLAIEGVSVGIKAVQAGVGPVVKSVSNLVEILGLQPGLSQAGFGGADWEFAGVLAAGDAFLGHRRDQLAIPDERRRRVMTLRYPVLALLKPWPMTAFELDRTFDPAETKDVHLRLRSWWPIHHSPSSRVSRLCPEVATASKSWSRACTSASPA